MFNTSAIYRREAQDEPFNKLAFILHKKKKNLKQVFANSTQITLYWWGYALHEWLAVNRFANRFICPALDLYTHNWVTTPCVKACLWMRVNRWWWTCDWITHQLFWLHPDCGRKYRSSLNCECLYLISGGVEVDWRWRDELMGNVLK